MSRALIIINTDWDRQKAVAWAGKAPWGTRVEWKAPKRTLDQNSRFWAMLTDVASQVEHAGHKYSTEEWKLLFMHAWGREVRFLPGLDQKSVVPVGQSSSDLTKEEMGDLMEFISAWGAEHGVTFNETHQPSDAPPASDVGRDAPSPTPAPNVAATSHSDGELDAGNGAGAPDDSGSVEPDLGTAATPSSGEEEKAAGEDLTGDLSASPAAELECIEKMMATAVDKTITPKDAAEILANSADMWLGKFSDDRRPFVTSVFQTCKKVLRNELPADKAKIYLEGLAA